MNLVTIIVPKEAAIITGGFRTLCSENVSFSHNHHTTCLIFEYLE